MAGQVHFEQYFATGLNQPQSLNVDSLELLIRKSEWESFTTLVPPRDAIDDALHKMKRKTWAPLPERPWFVYFERLSVVLVSGSVPARRTTPRLAPHGAARALRLASILSVHRTVAPIRLVKPAAAR